jgi:cell division protein FtsN
MGLGATLLFAALLIYLAMILPLAQQKSQLPQSIPWYHGGTGATANGQSSVRPVVKKPAVKKTAPKATTKAEETKVRFEFYNILPKSEVIIPQPKTIGPKAKPVVKTPLPIATGNNANQLLQVGSFRSAADADRLRARLALLGLNPKINSVQIDGQQTWHRVQLGPFANQQQLADTQAILSLAKVNSLLIRQP